MYQTVDRHIIHQNFFLQRLNREDFFVEIDRAKNYLSTRFTKGDNITIAYTSNNVISLAFIFACFELGISIMIGSEEFYCGPENHSERFENISSMITDYVKKNNRWVTDGMVNDLDDKILGGHATKREIYRSSFQDFMSQYNTPNLYMGNYKDFSIDKIDSEPHEHLTSHFDDGDWVSEMPSIVYKSHEEVMNSVENINYSFENKIVGLTKNMHHHDALHRLILPALMQSGRVVDFQIPEPDFGGYFITNDKITMEALFDYCIKYAHKMIDAYKVDIIMAPTDDTLFEFLSRRDKDFRKPLEIILHNEITSEHRWWESELNIKFVV